MDDRRIVCCVKWGDKYSADHVNLLYGMVKRHCSSGFRFCCLTDDSLGLDEEILVIPIADRGLIGWWNKLLVFAD